MGVAQLCFLLFLGMTGHSCALYCVCKDGVSDSALQKSIDYACGAGADCTPILQNGACYNPNTVKDHCSYAVNSYFQRKNQGPGTCDFSGTANTAQTITGQASGCNYPSSSGGGGTTPSGVPGTNPATTFSPGSNLSPPFNLGPNSNDNNGGLYLQPNRLLYWCFSLALLFSGIIMFLRI